MATEIDEYLKTKMDLKKQTPQKKNTIPEKKNQQKVMKCKLDHSLSSNFRVTDQAWEVSKVKCYGGCKKYFETVICGPKKLVWFCEGTK